MTTDCTLCLEWELCPFHDPKKLELTEYVEVDVPTIDIGIEIKKTGRVVSDCGFYVRTYVNGVCVDEEPID